MSWRVLIDGQDSGIIETNYKFALAWWAALSIRRGCRVTLKEIEQ